MHTAASPNVNLPTLFGGVWPALKQTQLRPVFALLLAVLCFHHVAYGQSKVQQIEALLCTAQSREQLNGSVLVSEKGRVLYSKAFGYGDIEKKIPLRR